MNYSGREAAAVAVGNHPTATRLQGRLRELAGYFYTFGVAMLLIIGNFVRLPPPTNRLVVNVVALLGWVLIVSLRYIPWHRFHQNLLVIHTWSTVALLALLVANTGGVHSPFRPFTSLSPSFPPSTTAATSGS